MIMKNSLVAFVALSSAICAWAHGEEAAKEMGPVAFMWPTDRVWGAAYDNTAPCGSSSGVVNRTNFPLGESNFESENASITVPNKGASSQWPACTCHPRRIMECPGCDIS
jgi:hypothetical protein